MYLGLRCADVNLIPGAEEVIGSLSFSLESLHLLLLSLWRGSLQIEELASGLSFSSRQSSMESLASLDSRSTLSSRSASSSPVPPRGSPLHHRFRVSAKKALLLWVREQCHK